MEGKPIDVVVEFFKQKEWNYELDEENERVRSGFDNGWGEFVLFVSAHEEKKLCFVLSAFPVKCPENRRKQCAELLARLNYGMLVGCFELDFDNGRIHFKTSAPFTETGLDLVVVQALVIFNLSIMKKCMPGVLSVVYGRVSPKKAAAQIEAGAEQKTKEKMAVSRGSAPDTCSNN